MRTRLKLIGAWLAALLIIASVGFYAWTRVAGYRAFPEAVARAEGAQSEHDWYVFEPTDDPAAGFTFYPGGLSLEVIEGGNTAHRCQSSLLERSAD